MTSERRLEIVDRAGFSAWLVMFCKEGEVHFTAAHEQVPHDTALHFLWGELSWEKRRKCTHMLSHEQWNAFLDGVRAMEGAEVRDCLGYMADFKVGDVVFYADRLDDGIKLSLNVPHNLYGAETYEICSLSVRDALALIEECVTDERLLSAYVAPYRAALLSGVSMFG